MKKLFVLLVLVSMTLVSCEKGETSQNLTGNEQGLPPELKGMKVYTVQDGGISTIKVAVLNNKINSVTYPVGKTTETTIIIDNGSDTKRIIEAVEVLSETDDIIVIRKK